jgi:hypothetical protein
MDKASRRRQFTTRRCTRCTRSAIIVVEFDDRGDSIAACVEHLEWAFLVDLDEWSGRRAAG